VPSVPIKTGTLGLTHKQLQVLYNIELTGKFPTTFTPLYLSECWQ